jgi:hypothetical protein
VDYLGRGVWRFFVPAVSLEEGAFEARTARYEGFWRSSSHADENMPWPEPDAKWPQRAPFLEMLDRAEAEAQRVHYRGLSRCRLCGCLNGSQSFRLDVWEWPQGSDTMWSTTTFGHLVNLNSSFENGCKRSTAHSVGAVTRPFILIRAYPGPSRSFQRDAET